MFGGEILPESGGQRNAGTFVDSQSHLARFNSPLIFVEGERIKVKDLATNVNQKKLSLTFLLFLAKGKATKALRPHLSYRQAGTRPRHERRNAASTRLSACRAVPTRRRVEPFQLEQCQKPTKLYEGFSDIKI
jgi:hypothetical protein